MLKLSLLPLLTGLVAACGQSPSATPPSDCPELQAECPATPPTYAAGIGALIGERCSPCHAPGGIEAESVLLTDYQSARMLTIGIGTQVQGCLMPPAGSPPLSDDERQQILEWLKCGAKP